MSRVGMLTVRPVDPAGDAALLHRWLTHPRSAYWLMPHASLAEVRQEYERIAASPDQQAFLGLHDGEPGRWSPAPGSRRRPG